MFYINAIIAWFHLSCKHAFHSLNNNLSNIIQIKQGYFGINGASTSWTQHTSYPQTYQYPYKFPDVDGYKFVIGFTLLGWTGSNVYKNYLLKTTATTAQEGKTELYSGDGTPSTVIYYIGLYIKSV